MIRRISRESVFTADIIDSTARLILLLIENVEQHDIHLYSFCRIDRPSIKVFTRVIVLGGGSKAWQWIFTHDPFKNDEQQLFNKSRRLLFSRILDYIKPSVDFNNNQAVTLPKLNKKSLSIVNASAELVIQNYDYCILILDSILSQNKKDYKALKLLALAYVNMGLYDESLVILQDALAYCDDPIFKASLYYAKGLILQKRKRQSLAAVAAYDAGLNGLRSFEINNETDSHHYHLEQAWLNNGLCLYKALKLKENDDEVLFYEIYNTLCHSLSSLSNNYNNDAIYLKSNLISNASFLMEMRKQYSDSFNLLSTYYQGIADLNKYDLRSCHINYRLGVLQLKMQHYSQALTFLKMSLAALNDLAQPFLEEKLCRVIAIAYLGLKKTEQARIYLKKGLAICVSQCATNGIQYYETKLQAPHLTIDFNSISPKLPAYIPEIDLEDIPAVNLNEYLGK
ncbi:hypothetical protein [Cysteiniphilum sp. 6C5]|uniref:hypothetical protein n=1 Tax=unclassified Cysteiniphilum TaxID=2610889 RepID=UPI003F866B4D